MNFGSYYTPQYPQYGQYNQYQPQNQAMPQAQPQPQQGGMIWVQGEAAAKSYMVAPSSTVVLWDSENPTIYIKQTDQSGLPLPMRILDWSERGGGPVQTPNPTQEFVTREEFNALLARLNGEQKEANENG